MLVRPDIFLSVGLKEMLGATPSFFVKVKTIINSVYGVYDDN